jgi:hypothetical protein
MNNLHTMSYRIRGLPFAPFQDFTRLDELALGARGAVRVIATDDTFPCRVTLAHAGVGESLLLLNYTHLDSPHSPYHASGPIYVREAFTETFEAENQLPAPLRSRLLSLRAYAEGDMMVDAEVIDGKEADVEIERMLQCREVRFIHVHYARRGCYAARIDRF